MAASSAYVRTVERGYFGPVLRSSTVRHLRHFMTVFGLMPSSGSASRAKLAILGLQL